MTETEFAERYSEAFPALWCIAAAILGDRSGAEDIVQEAAMSAFQKLSHFDPGTSFVNWIGRFVRFHALNAARLRTRRALEVRDPLDLDRVPAAQHDAESPAAHAMLDAQGDVRSHQRSFDDEIIRALRRLPRPQRVCLLMRVVLELSYQEIARTLGLSEGTVASHVHRGREALRATLLPLRPATCHPLEDRS